MYGVVVESTGNSYPVLHYLSSIAMQPVIWIPMLSGKCTAQSQGGPCTSLCRDLVDLMCRPCASGTRGLVRGALQAVPLKKLRAMHALIITSGKHVRSTALRDACTAKLRG
jgi:hypothetical protein